MEVEMTKNKRKKKKQKKRKKRRRNYTDFVAFLDTFCIGPGMIPVCARTCVCVCVFVCVCMSLK